jgi:hypothetical protein
LENGSPSKKGNNGKSSGGFGGYYGEIGNWTYWKYYSNGQLEKKYIKDQNGNYTGNYEEYFENRELKQKGKYIDGEEEGEWYFYYIDKAEKYKILFKNGVLIKSKKVNSVNDPIEDQFFKLNFKNKCYKEIQLAIMIKNFDDEWETKGFYDIEPNEEVYLANTENRIYYFYAHIIDGKTKWKGDFKDTVQVDQYNFKEKTIPSDKEYGDH